MNRLLDWALVGIAAYVLYVELTGASSPLSSILTPNASQGGATGAPGPATTPSGPSLSAPTSVAPSPAPINLAVSGPDIPPQLTVLPATPVLAVPTPVAGQSPSSPAPQPPPPLADAPAIATPVVSGLFLDASGLDSADDEGGSSVAA